MRPQFFVVDSTANTSAPFLSVLDAFTQAAFLMSLGHDVKITKGGK